jgi:hypothetical protein
MNRVTLTDKQVQEALINPYYAIDLDGRLFEPHPHTISEVDRIEANKQLLKELGPDAYLRRLLDVLKGQSQTQDRKP